MIKIIASRRAGKTTSIVRLCKNLNGILLTTDYVHKQFYIKQFNMNPKRVLTVNEYIKLKRRPKNKIYVDDVDYVLSLLLGGKLGGFTVNIIEKMEV